MNKKNIILILIGIFFVSLRFNISFGHITIDIANDCIGFLLIILGAVHMMNRNSLFKKAGVVSVIGLIASVIAQAINFVDWQDAAQTMSAISMGITVIFAIYFTYYFTEALIQCTEPVGSHKKLSAYVACSVSTCIHPFYCVWCSHYNSFNLS